METKPVHVHQEITLYLYLDVEGKFHLFILKYIARNEIPGDRTQTTDDIQIHATYEPHHDKTNKMAYVPAKTQISLGICPV